jgi:hypothetical protein
LPIGKELSNGKITAAERQGDEHVAPWQSQGMAPTTMGGRLRLAMETIGTTGVALSARTGVDAGQISKTISGRQSAMSVQSATAICIALGVEVVWLVDGAGPMWSVPPPGRAALDATLRTMTWPEPVDVRACDAVVAMAQREAETVARDRPESVWVPRLRELYRQALEMPPGCTDESAPPSGPPVLTPAPSARGKRSRA